MSQNCDLLGEPLDTILKHKREGTWSDEAEAAKNLCLAAPEMLSILQLATDLLECFHGSEYAKHVLGLARAAIAKAEGKESK